MILRGTHMERKTMRFEAAEFFLCIFLLIWEHCVQKFQNSVIYVTYHGAASQKFNNTLACQCSVFVAIKRPHWRNYLRFASAWLMYICCETFTVNAIAPVYCRAAGAQRLPKKVVFDARAYLCR
jgi:hypothetical protein